MDNDTINCHFIKRLLCTDRYVQFHFSMNTTREKCIWKKVKPLPPRAHPCGILVHAKHVGVCLQITSICTIIMCTSSGDMNERDPLGDVPLHIIRFWQYNRLDRTYIMHGHALSKLIHEDQIKLHVEIEWYRNIDKVYTYKYITYNMLIYYEGYTIRFVPIFLCRMLLNWRIIMWCRFYP